ncbi:MAG: uroporphyrinogen-III synthase [Proteobacteria bacterium]|nr:uroporphyrinogen-III synthase [Pseudomonadota bacterium]
MTYIFTRPKENIKGLDELIGDVVYVPLFAYEKVDIDIHKLLHFKAYTLSSQEASRFVVKNKLPIDALYYCVGRQTAFPLVENKYQNIVLSDQFNAQSLVHKIKCVHDPFIPLAYLSGEVIKLAMDKELSKKGFVCERFIVYQTKMLAFDFSIFEKKRGGYIVFYSIGTYEFFLEGVKALSLKKQSLFKNWTCIFVLSTLSKGGVFSNLYDIDWNKKIILKSTHALVQYFKGVST